MTTTAITTRIDAAPGKTNVDLMEAIISDADLLADVPTFIGLNNGIVELTTTGPNAAVDGMAYVAMLMAVGLAVRNETAYQTVGFGSLAAVVGQ